MDLKKIKVMLKNNDVSFDKFYDYLHENDVGNWDNINSEDTIKDYCKEMIDEGIHIYHILEVINNNPSKNEIYIIWLGNSMETPIPINTKQDLLDGLGVKE